MAARCATQTLRGNSGESLVRDFKVNVNMLAPRLIWVAPQPVLGGSLALRTAVPLLDGTSAPTARASRARAWATSASARRWLSYLAGAAPSVRRRCLRAHGHDAKDPSSLGKNYWTIQPLAAT